jgi:hypothetical protein
LGTHRLAVHAGLLEEHRQEHSGPFGTLIRTMSQANPRWGAPRIHGELLKPGLDVCETTVAIYMVRPRRPSSQTWRTFLRNQVGQIVVTDFFVVRP